MADLRHPGDPEALPWLEAVDDEDQPPAISAKKMLGALVLVLVGVGIIAGTSFYLGREQGGSGPPELILAAQGPYKVKPDDPGGLDVSGDSGTAFATGAGQDQDSKLDVGRMSEPPPPPPAEGEAAKPKPEPVKPKPVETPPAPPVAGAAAPTIQLGAYGSTAKAEIAWKMLSSRFPAVAGLTKQVVPYGGGYRLRAVAGSSAQAKEACAAVTAGGENCFVVR